MTPKISATQINVSKVVKRDSSLVEFSFLAIADSIFKAAQSVGGKDREQSIALAHEVVELLNQAADKETISSAKIQELVEKVLVLDEATSSLDSQTEHEIQKDLARLMRGRTTIIIAHRLSTIMQADTIVVMERGKIVQTGTHAQLITQPGKYKKLWQLQRGGYLV